MDNKLVFKMEKPFMDIVLDVAEKVLKNAGYDKVMEHFSPGGPTILQYKDKDGKLISIRSEEVSNGQMELDIQSEKLDISDLVKSLFLETYLYMGEKLISCGVDERAKEVVKSALRSSKGGK